MINHMKKQKHVTHRQEKTNRNKPQDDTVLELADKDSKATTEFKDLKEKIATLNEQMENYNREIEIYKNKQI